MIDPQAAQRKVLRHTRMPGVTAVPVDAALGFVLAESVTTRIAMPAFDNSAMDGFAIRSRDSARATSDRPTRLRLSATVFAGDGRARRLRPQEACGIMTGAMLPKGADAIIPIEDALVSGDVLIVGRPVGKYRHVRREGEEVTRGACVAKRNVLVHAGVVGAIAAAGIARVSVYRKPRVSVITTGDETVDPGKRLTRGQIYDSNSHMVAAMLRQMGIEPSGIRRVKDSPGVISQSIRAALRSSDVVIVLGGVSVGDRDYVRPVLNELGVEQIFWRVNQKPGKPIYFGKRGEKLVFGLPGNPASGFVCFYMYVYPAIRRMSGIRDAVLPRDVAVAAGPIAPDARRWLLLKASTKRGKGEVTALRRQGSHMVTSLADTNSLIVVPPGAGTIARGDNVDIIRLPGPEGLE